MLKCLPVKVAVDQLVAAPYSHDDKWYRARVTEVKLDDYEAEESQVALYYLDYGDSDMCCKKELCSLRADFLKLRYQAIECSLAKVKAM
jgi:tudor domain-containing protein 2